MITRIVNRPDQTALAKAVWFSFTFCKSILWQSRFANVKQKKNHTIRDLYLLRYGYCISRSFFCESSPIFTVKVWKTSQALEFSRTYSTWNKPHARVLSVSYVHHLPRRTSLLNLSNLNGVFCFLDDPFRIKTSNLNISKLMQSAPYTYFKSWGLH